MIKILMPFLYLTLLGWGSFAVAEESAVVDNIKTQETMLGTEDLWNKIVSTTENLEDSINSLLDCAHRDNYYDVDTGDCVYRPEVVCAADGLVLDYTSNGTACTGLSDIQFAKLEDRESFSNSANPPGGFALVPFTTLLNIAFVATSILTGGFTLILGGFLANSVGTLFVDSMISGALSQDLAEAGVERTSYEDYRYCHMAGISISAPAGGPRMIFCHLYFDEDLHWHHFYGTGKASILGTTGQTVCHATCYKED